MLPPNIISMRRLFQERYCFMNFIVIILFSISSCVNYSIFYFCFHLSSVLTSTLQYYFILLTKMQLFSLLSFCVFFKAEAVSIIYHLACSPHVPPFLPDVISPVRFCKEPCFGFINFTYFLFPIFLTHALNFTIYFFSDSLYLFLKFLCNFSSLFCWILYSLVFSHCCFLINIVKALIFKTNIAPYSSHKFPHVVFLFQTVLNISSFYLYDFLFN